MGDMSFCHIITLAYGLTNEYFSYLVHKNFVFSKNQVDAQHHNTHLRQCNQTSIFYIFL